MGRLPLRVNFLVEGEEEIGSVHLDEFCRQNAQLLQADGCLWETGGVSATEQPSIHCGAKGICYVELVARTASDDLHSANATIVPNAAWRLTWALATLKDRDERVLIPGFYDAVRPPSAADIAALETIPDDDDVLLKSFGIPRFLNNLSGIEGKKAHLFNPTCTICGIVSGYTGPGSKTVLPSEARAKIDFRLVPDMDPAEIVRLLRAHLDANEFQDIEIIELGHERAARSDLDFGRGARHAHGARRNLRPPADRSPDHGRHRADVSGVRRLRHAGDQRLRHRLHGHADPCARREHSPRRLLAGDAQHGSVRAGVCRGIMNNVKGQRSNVEG